MSTKHLSQSEHYVAFLDILGYTDYVKQKECDETNKFLQIVEKAMSAVLDKIQELPQTPDSKFKPKIKIFSDNILIAVECPDNIEICSQLYIQLLMFIESIQQDFLIMSSLLIRGGVTRGMFFFSENFVFGEALIRAYEMEKQANYPRIILEESDIEKVTNFLQSSKNSIISSEVLLFLNLFVVQDTDNEYFIDLFSIPTKYIKSDINIRKAFAKNKLDSKEEILDITGNEQAEMRINILQRCAECIKANLKAFGNYDNILHSRRKDVAQQIAIRRNVIIKYVWLLDYFNTSCDLDEDTVLCRINYYFETDLRVHLPKIVVA